MSSIHLDGLICVLRTTLQCSLLIFYGTCEFFYFLPDASNNRRQVSCPGESLSLYLRLHEGTRPASVWPPSIPRTFLIFDNNTGQIQPNRSPASSYLGHGEATNRMGVPPPSELLAALCIYFCSDGSRSTQSCCCKVPANQEAVQNVDGIKK
jgi:hypothetical protein